LSLYDDQVEAETGRRARELFDSAVKEAVPAVRATAGRPPKSDDNYGNTIITPVGSSAAYTIARLKRLASSEEAGAKADEA
jgi:hypothetical protein